MNMPEQSPWRRRFPLLIILLICFTVRVALLIEHAQSPLFAHLRIDEIEYRELALGVMEGQALAEALPNHGPGYSWLLGGVFAVFGPGLLAIRLLQIFMGLGSAALVYTMGKRLFDERAAAAGALLLGLYPPLVIFEQRFLATSLFVFLCLVALSLTMRARERMTVGAWAAAGLVFGLSALVRPTSLPVMLVLAGWAALTIKGERRRRGPLLAAALVAASLAPVAPVMIENQRRFGEGLMIQMNGGLNLFLGNNPEADGTPYARPDGVWDLIESMPVKEQGLLKAKDQDRFYAGKVIEFMRRDPGAFALLQLKKLGLFFNHREIRATIDPEFHRRFFAVTSLPWPGFGLAFALALAGVPSLNLRKPGHQALLIFLAAAAAETVATVVASRYRLPFFAALTVLSGAGLGGLYQAARAAKKAPRPLLARSGLFAAGLVIAWLPLGPRHSDAEELMHLGAAWQEQGDEAKAREYFLEAIEADPRHSMSMLSMCELTYQQEYKSDALEWCKKAMAADPFNSAPPFQMGMMLWAQGDHEEAVRELVRAVSLRPQYLPARFQLALREIKLGRFREARGHLEFMLRLWPDHPDALELIRLMDQAKSGRAGKGEP